MGGHATYLAVIALLVLLLVYASAKAVRAHRVMADVEARFGVASPGRAAPPRREPLRALGAAALLRPRTLDQYRREVDALLARAQALGEFGGGEAPRLAAACGAALAGGKRLRAAVLLEVARATSAARVAAAGARPAAPPTPVDAAEAALFVEYVHAASLVVDDMPAFDNDATRRGGPSLHAAVGPAVAQMAALGLVAAAFQNVCRQVDWLRDHCPEVKNADRVGTRLCALASGALARMGRGQLLELTPEDWPAVAGAAGAAGAGGAAGGGVPEEIAACKTAALFEAAVGAGWLVAGGDPAALGQVALAGRKLGVAFQIADDVGDAEGDAGRAAAAGRPSANYALAFGRDIALADVELNLRGAALLLARQGLWTPLWRDEIFPAVRAMAAPAAPAGPPPGA